MTQVIKNHYSSTLEFFADYMRARIETNFLNIDEVPLLSNFYPFLASWTYLRKHGAEIGDLVARRAFSEISADIPLLYTILDVSSVLKDPYLKGNDRNTKINKIRRYDYALKSLRSMTTADAIEASYNEAEKRLERLKTIPKGDVERRLKWLSTVADDLFAAHRRRQFSYPADPAELDAMIAEKTQALVQIAEKARRALNERQIPPAVKMLGKIDNSNGYPLTPS